MSVILGRPFLGGAGIILRRSLQQFSTKQIPKSITHDLQKSSEPKPSNLRNEGPSSVTIRPWNEQKESVREDYCRKLEEVTRDRLIFEDNQVKMKE